jgi:opacity protein-like surface antigen
MGFMGIGGKLGLVDPQHFESTIGFGVFADLGTFSPKFHLEANIDYWSKSETVLGSEYTVRDFVFGGTVKYVHEVEGQKFKPFGLGGLHLHLINGESQSDAKVGIDLGGGTYYATSPKLDLMVELRYRVVSDVSQLVLSAGALYYWGQ